MIGKGQSSCNVIHKIYKGKFNCFGKIQIAKLNKDKFICFLTLKTTLNDT